MAAEYAYNYNAYYRTNAAPALEPVPQRQPQPVPRPHVVPKPPRPQRPAVDRRQQERASNIKLAKLFVVMALAIALLGTFCNSFVARSNSRRALEDKRAELSIYTNAGVVLDQKLSKLIVFYDRNQITIEGSTDIAFTEDVGARFAAFGWQVIEVTDGEDMEAIYQAMEMAKKDTERPSLIIVRTQIGYGTPKAGTPSPSSYWMRTMRSGRWRK